MIVAPKTIMPYSYKFIRFYNMLLKALLGLLAFGLWLVNNQEDKPIPWN